MLKLMHLDLQPQVWKALGSFVQLCIRDEVRGDESGEGGAIAEGGASRLANTPLVQLATLLGAGLSLGGTGAAGAAAERAEAALVARCKQMVGAMRHVEPALTEWSAYVPRGRNLARPQREPLFCSHPPRRTLTPPPPLPSRDGDVAGTRSC